MIESVNRSSAQCFTNSTLITSLRSIGGVFETLHGFNIGQVGTVFATMTCVAISHPIALLTRSGRIGALIGFVSNVHQETLYQ
jgi:hypothetical protein